MSGPAEYTHETYGTGRAVIELKTGRVEILSVLSPDVFLTDREITQAEYDKIRDCLRQMHDCALMSSNPRGLVKQ